MAGKKIEQLSTEELLKKQKTYKKSTGALIGIYAFLAIAMVITLAMSDDADRTGFIGLGGAIVAGIGSITALLSSLKKVEQELSKRAELGQAE